MIECATVAQPGRALGWRPSCRAFKSRRWHFSFGLNISMSQWHGKTKDNQSKNLKSRREFWYSAEWDMMVPAQAVKELHRGKMQHKNGSKHTVRKDVFVYANVILLFEYLPHMGGFYFYSSEFFSAQADHCPCNQTICISIMSGYLGHDCFFLSEYLNFCSNGKQF